MIMRSAARGQSAHPSFRGRGGAASLCLPRPQFPVGLVDSARDDMSPEQHAEENAEEHAFVSFRDVQKSYDGVKLVVKRLSLDIRKGEFLTLLGPSGSGKTTSLMMLAGFEVPTAGQISVGGRDLTHLPPHKRDIGMVFQNYALFPHMSVAENVAFPLMARRHPKPEMQTRVRQALARVKMEEYAQRRPGQLSGGQQQRVALARALVFEPALVLMDEPLGALDKQLREHMQMEIKHLHDELGITVVYVTHDQDEALAMSDRIAVFNDGVIEQIGSARDIYEAPQTVFVSSFVGENNHVPGQVHARLPDGRALVSTTEGDVVATPVGNPAEGSPVLLSLRPERVTPLQHGRALDNLFEGRVIEMVYFGDHLRMKCSLPGGNVLTVKMANGAELGECRVGDVLTLGWRAEDCRALPADGARR
jgi:putative spermidine/putrescine transport system ATP-binding protein